MSRSGYEEIDGRELNLYKGRVARTIKGKRGQCFLKELAEAMDVMPVKELIKEELINEYGDCCAIGVVCKHRGMNVKNIDYDDPYSVGKAVNVSTTMAAEIEFMNDEWGSGQETHAQRWSRMRKWVDIKITKKGE